nr:hypothetical protein [Pseudomonas sp.]
NGNGNGNGNNGNSGGQGNSSGSGNGNGNSGSSGNGSSGSGSGGNGNGSSSDSQATGTNGTVNSSSNRNDGARSGSPEEANRGAELSQNDVLAAVEAGSAVSLESILPDVRTRTGGEVIDAKLQRTQGFLIYAVTVLTPAGKVVTEYYYARSGIHVEVR